MFADSVACHQTAEALEISIVVLVLDNAEWGAVCQWVLDIYPDGHTARANAVLLTELSPSPDFAQVAKASRPWARHVRDADGVKAALTEVPDHEPAKRGLALIEVAIGKG